MAPGPLQTSRGHGVLAPVQAGVRAMREAVANELQSARVVSAMNIADAPPREGHATSLDGFPRRAMGTVYCGFSLEPTSGQPKTTLPPRCSAPTASSWPYRSLRSQKRTCHPTSPVGPTSAHLSGHPRQAEIKLTTRRSKFQNGSSSSSSSSSVPRRF